MENVTSQAYSLLSQIMNVKAVDVMSVDIIVATENVVTSQAYSLQ
jgi:hypothetical protein